jgi:hypothetical protein
MADKTYDPNEDPTADGDEDEDESGVRVEDNEHELCERFNTAHSPPEMHVEPNHTNNSE